MKQNAFISFRVWLRAIGIYALLTLPALSMVPIYFVSLILAIAWSLPAAILFALARPWLTHRQGQGARLAWHLVVVTLLTAACTLLATFHVSRGFGYWESLSSFHVFPLAGILAAFLSVITNRRLLEA
jgi:hypothetical protein